MIRRQLRSGALRPENALVAFVGAGVSIAIAISLFVVVFNSFRSQQSLFTAVYSLDNYARLASARTLAALGNSLVIGLGSAILAGTWGISLAWMVARTDMPFRRVLDTANLIPFFLSPLLGAVAWSFLGSPAIGLLNRLLMPLLSLSQAPINIYSQGGIVWVVGLFEVPFVYLFCVGALRQMDPALEHASRICGSNGIITSLRITLPLAAPSIFSGLILAFVLGVEDLSAPLVLGYSHGIETLSTQIYDSVQSYPPDFNFGAAIGCLMLVITVSCLLLQNRVLSKRSFVTITGKGFRPQRIRLGRARYLALLVNLLYLVLAVILPLSTLAVVSISRGWQGVVDPSQFTTQYYAYLLNTSQLALRGLRNSLFLAVFGATITLVVSTIVAYGIHRSAGRWRHWLDVVTTVPVAVPGLVLAVGLLVALIRTPLYGTLGILLVAYAVRYFSYGQRSVSASLVAVSDEVEKSSRTSGAGWFTTVWRILLPLLRPGMAAGWLLLFITFVREVSMSMLLSRSGTETLSVALFSLVTYDPTGASAAYTVAQVAVILVAALLFLRLAGREGIQV